MLGPTAPLPLEEQRLSDEAGRLLSQINAELGQLEACEVPNSNSIALESSIKERFRVLKRVLDDLQVAAEEQDTIELSQRVAQCLGTHQNECNRAQKAFFNIRLTLQKNKEKAFVKQRQELIGSVDFSMKQHKFQTEQDMLYGAEDVTTVLRRTRQMMMQNLEQTHGNISVLDTTNKQLVSTRDELQGQKQVFKESRGLLGSLKSQSRWERFALWFGFAFFLCTVGYISFQRTPAFMKEPLYALLHMKPGGTPYTQEDYEGVVPRGAFGPPPGWTKWFKKEEYPEAWRKDWEREKLEVEDVWESQLHQQPMQPRRDAFQDAELWDADTHEPAQREQGGIWQRGQPSPGGEPLPPQHQQQQQAEQLPPNPQQHNHQQQQQPQQHGDPQIPHLPEQQQQLGLSQEEAPVPPVPPPEAPSEGKQQCHLDGTCSPEQGAVAPRPEPSTSSSKESAGPEAAEGGLGGVEMPESLIVPPAADAPEMKQEALRPNEVGVEQGLQPPAPAAPGAEQGLQPPTPAAAGAEIPAARLISGEGELKAAVVGNDNLQPPHAGQQQQQQDVQAARGEPATAVGEQQSSSREAQQPGVSTPASGMAPSQGAGGASAELPEALPGTKEPQQQLQQEQQPLSAASEALPAGEHVLAGDRAVAWKSEDVPVPGTPRQEGEDPGLQQRALQSQGLAEVESGKGQPVAGLAVDGTAGEGGAGDGAGAGGAGPVRLEQQQQPATKAGPDAAAQDAEAGAVAQPAEQTPSETAASATQSLAPAEAAPEAAAVVPVSPASAGAAADLKPDALPQAPEGPPGQQAAGGEEKPAAAVPPQPAAETPAAAAAPADVLAGAPVGEPTAGSGAGTAEPAAAQPAEVSPVVQESPTEGAEAAGAGEGPQGMQSEDREVGPAAAELVLATPEAASELAAPAAGAAAVRGVGASEPGLGGDAAAPPPAKPAAEPDTSAATTAEPEAPAQAPEGPSSQARTAEPAAAPEADAASGEAAAPAPEAAAVSQGPSEAATPAGEAEAAGAAAAPNAPALEEAAAPVAALYIADTGAAQAPSGLAGADTEAVERKGQEDGQAEEKQQQVFKTVLDDEGGLPTDMGGEGTSDTQKPGLKGFDAAGVAEEVPAAETAGDQAPAAGLQTEKPQQQPQEDTEAAAAEPDAEAPATDTGLRLEPAVGSGQEEAEPVERVLAQEGPAASEATLPPLPPAAAGGDGRSVDAVPTLQEESAGGDEQQQHEGEVKEQQQQQQQQQDQQHGLEEEEQQQREGSQEKVQQQEHQEAQQQEQPPVHRTGAADVQQPEKQVAPAADVGHEAGAREGDMSDEQQQQGHGPDLNMPAEAGNKEEVIGAGGADAGQQQGGEEQQQQEVPVADKDSAVKPVSRESLEAAAAAPGSDRAKVQQGSKARMARAAGLLAQQLKTAGLPGAEAAPVTAAGLEGADPEGKGKGEDERLGSHVEREYGLARDLVSGQEGASSGQLTVGEQQEKGGQQHQQQQHGGGECVSGEACRSSEGGTSVPEVQHVQGHPQRREERELSPQQTGKQAATVDQLEDEEDYSSYEDDFNESGGSEEGMGTPSSDDYHPVGQTDEPSASFEPGAGSDMPQFEDVPPGYLDPRVRVAEPSDEQLGDEQGHGQPEAPFIEFPETGLKVSVGAEGVEGMGVDGGGAWNEGHMGHGGFGDQYFEAHDMYDRDQLFDWGMHDGSGHWGGMEGVWAGDGY